MNKISQNGTRVVQTQNSIIVNGTEYPLPEKVKSSTGNRMQMINGRIIINGYVFDAETGEFTRAFPFLWALIIVAACILYYLFFQ